MGEGWTAVPRECLALHHQGGPQGKPRLSSLCASPVALDKPCSPLPGPRQLSPRPAARGAPEPPLSQRTLAVRTGNVGSAPGFQQVLHDAHFKSTAARKVIHGKHSRPRLSLKRTQVVSEKVLRGDGREPPSSAPLQPLHPRSSWAPASPRLAPTQGGRAPTWLVDRSSGFPSLIPT